MLEIYNSSFNLLKGKFDFEDMLGNFCAFADRVTIAINTSEDGTFEALSEWGAKNAPNKLNLVNTGFEYSDPAFDGKIKNEALQGCKEDYCILLDADERINPKDRPKWEAHADLLSRNPQFDALLIPVIDLCKNLSSYKDIGSKWYLHRNHIGIQRGVVDFAKLDNGKIDIKKSDSCEAIYQDGSLVKAGAILNPSAPGVHKLQAIREKGVPFVWHTGWVDLEHRLRMNNFWKPVWENRAGKEVNDIIQKLEELDKIEVYPHNLPLWK